MSKRIPLTQGQFAIVDNEDFKALSKYKWYAHYSKARNVFIAARNSKHRVNRKSIKMHRQIMNTPDGMQTDHINHDTLDNRRGNLRECTASQNRMNTKKYSNNTSGATGIYWHKINKKWQAYITIKQKRIHLGIFGEIEDAIKARRQAEIKHFGEFAYNGS